MLRLPGTWNHKGRARGGESLPVLIVEGKRAERDWTPDELDELLGPPPENYPHADSSAPVMPGSELAHLLDRLPAGLLGRLRETPAGDRSGQSYAFVGACLKTGLSDAETLALALEHKPTQSKYGDRAAAEIERAIAKQKVRPPRDAPGTHPGFAPEAGVDLEGASLRPP